ncbi:hypothetical protein B0H14DRAFT_2937463 [Mycena olivaceomarginata]|nr:hypothetical protein B0H14DRAFT_3028102 [Mycena olivaceomarginata]KAJ7791005.1 hypothetical protein B0H14DRAFT_2937463 [Mycena olivaceomarginata]
MANPQNVEKEKEWKGLKLTPIVEDEDGSNNYSEFRQKSTLDLDAVGLLKYVAGPDYDPPVIPDLIPTMQAQVSTQPGISPTSRCQGTKRQLTRPKKNAEAWLLADKKAHALIVKAVPSARLYICDVNEDPVNWRQVMIQLYGKLRDADPFMMPDTEFAKHLVTLMTLSDKWRYCRDSLREKVRQGDAMQSPSHLRGGGDENCTSIVSINASTPNVYTANTAHNASAAGLSGQSSNQTGRRNDKVNQRQVKRPGPYNPQQRSGPRQFCANMFCETPVGHAKRIASRMVWKGGKDVHLAPEARIAARHKQALEASGSRFAGMTVGDGFAFMLELPDADTEDEISIGEEICVNAAALNLEVAQDDTLFHDYVQFDTPLNVHGFGANLSAQAVGKGKIVMTATYDGKSRQFSVSNALHIPHSPLQSYLGV